MSHSSSDLKAFSYNVKKWRKTRSYTRARLPEPLREEVAGLVDRHGLNVVSEESGLSTSVIRKIVKQSPKKPAQTFLPVKVKKEPVSACPFPVELCTESGVSIKVSSENLKDAIKLIKDQGLC